MACLIDGGAVRQVELHADGRARAGGGGAARRGAGARLRRARRRAALRASRLTSPTAALPTVRASPARVNPRSCSFFTARGAAATAPFPLRMAAPVPARAPSAFSCPPNVFGCNSPITRDAGEPMSCIARPPTLLPIAS